MPNFSPKDITKLGLEQFKKKGPVDSLLQDIADHFYPARADFTRQRVFGTEYADHLMSSYPVISRRELSDAIGVMLRTGPWFRATVNDKIDHSAIEWLDWATQKMRKGMDAKGTGFKRATKEADNDFVTFGNAGMTSHWDFRKNSMHYQTYHLRELAWLDNVDQEPDCVFRNWTPTIDQAHQYFGDKIGQEAMHKRASKKGGDQMKIMHCQLPTHMFSDNTKKYRPFTSMFINIEEEHVIAEIEMDGDFFIIPRFATVAGSPYGYSPAVMNAIPDARLLQAMTWTLLEAGELSAKPPMIATRNAIRSDVNLMSHGVTWVDEEYDERMGEALRPLSIDRNGLPIAFGQHEDTKESIRQALYLANMALPTGEEMTAYEVRERVKEFIRKNKPLFDPIEHEYSAKLCDLTFREMLKVGYFGPLEDVPRSLRGADIEFKFISPIQEAEEEGRAQQFSMMVDLVTMAASIDETTVVNVDLDQALRDAVSGQGAPQNWVREEDEVETAKQQMREDRAMQEKQAAMLEAAKVAQ